MNISPDPIPVYGDRRAHFFGPNTTAGIPLYRIPLLLTSYLYHNKGCCFHAAQERAASVDLARKPLAAKSPVFTDFPCNTRKILHPLGRIFRGEFLGS